MEHSSTVLHELRPENLSFLSDFGPHGVSDLHIQMFESGSESRRAVFLTSLSAFLESGEQMQTKHVLRIFLALMKRLKREYLEPSEELRLRILTCVGGILLRRLVAAEDVSNDLLSFLCASVADTCPEVRIEACGLVRKIFDGSKDLLSVERFTEEKQRLLVRSLSSCLRDTKWKVRLAGLEALRSCYPLAVLDEYWEDLDSLVYDRSDRVVEGLVDCMCDWLQGGNSECHSLSNRKSKLFYCLVGLALHSYESVRGRAILGMESIAHDVTIANGSEFSDNTEIFKRMRTLLTEDMRRIYSNVGTAALLKMHSKSCLDIAASVLGKTCSLSCQLSRKRYAIRVFALLIFFCEENQIERFLAMSVACFSDEDLNCENFFIELIPRLLVSRFGLEDIIACVEKLLQQSIKENSFARAAVQIKFLNILTYDLVDEANCLGEVLKCTEIAVLCPAVAGECLDVFDNVFRIDCNEELLNQVITCKENLIDSDIAKWEAILSRFEKPLVKQFFEKILCGKEFDSQKSRRLLVTLCSNYPEAIPIDRELLSLLGSWASDSDPLVRLDALEVLAALSERNLDLSEEEYGFIIENIIDVVCAWRTGLGSSKFRKAGLSIFRDLLSLKSSSVTNRVAKNSIRVIQSSMDDAWSPDNRLLAVLVANALIPFISETSADSVLSDLLKRLDDSHNLIRAEATQALAILFDRSSRDLFESAKTLLMVHANDPDPLVQKSVQIVLSKITF